MATVNMKAVGKLVAAANAAFDAWKLAGSYALTQHAGYSAALKANAASRDASETLRGYCNTLLTSLHSDPDTDPSWFQTIGKIRDGAIYQVQTLDTAKALVLADLAQHVNLFFSPGEAQKFSNPIDAAAAVDAKAKTAGDGNRKTPDKQDTSLPPVAAPPDEGSSWTRYAGFAAGGALLLWLARRAF